MDKEQQQIVDQKHSEIPNENKCAGGGSHLKEDSKTGPVSEAKTGTQVV